jgi:Icc-related predicted phosphoesterase
VKLVLISDTHGKHADLKLPAGDIIIHAGDISDHGIGREVEDFLQWFDGLKFRHKIFIAGNHDFYFEKEPGKVQTTIPPGVIYLQDSGVEVEGLKIWGSPVTPWFFNWAFNRHRGDAIKKHWKLIPAGTDILITHGPAFGVVDRGKNGEHLGCKDLCETITELKIPLHICGHIHEAHGNAERGNTRFINCSVLNEKYQLAYSPVVVKL